MATTDPDSARAEEYVTAQVLASFAGTPDPRLRELMEALVRHAHAFVRETRLTEHEWRAAVDMLTRVGQISDDRRQEFILLSDVLGISMLTIAVNHPAVRGATESTVFGPFFVENAPFVERGGDISGDASGEPCWVSGDVRSTSGEPIAGARIEVWEADDEGRYDVQYADGRVAGRAHLFSDDEGRYSFWGVTPTPYPIPDDGPVGALLAATNRSPMRAPHLHFMVSAPGYRTLITHIFVAGDPQNDADSVFGVKPSLIKDFRARPAGTVAPDGSVPATAWSQVGFDIALLAE